MAALLLFCPPAFAWGPEGHRLIGRAAFELLDATARTEVLNLLEIPAGMDPGEALNEACNWPDAIRDDPEWRWSSPLHYVNIPRHSEHYERERDCREGRCVTEGILHFAQQLSWQDLEPEKRKQALAFVCHLVADLHQPLHAGFRDDRGGNTVEISYRGEQWNLHQFWDGVVIRERLGDEAQMVTRLAAAGRAESGLAWKPESVKVWTDSSHELAVLKAYPRSSVIDESFANQTWTVSISQWEKATARLARVLNTVLGESDPHP